MTSFESGAARAGGGAWADSGDGPPGGSASDISGDGTEGAAPGGDGSFEVVAAAYLSRGGGLFKKRELSGAAEAAGAAHAAHTENEEPHTENEEPQPQVVAAFGLRMTNCAPERSSR